ncbi:uncharacterized protein METZ01_LOCUS499421, partial [marine metagenome]
MISKDEWLDPLYLESVLSDDEKSIKKSAKKFCEDKLLPIVVKNNQNHFFDKELYKEFGSMGLLGSTVIGFGSPEVNK